MKFHKSSLIFTNFHGVSQIFMKFHKSSWSFTNLHEVTRCWGHQMVKVPIYCPWRFNPFLNVGNSIENLKSSWNFTNLHGGSQIFMKVHKSSWRFTNLHEVPQIFMKYYKSSWSFINLYKVSQILHEVSQSFIKLLLRSPNE